ncbi:MAG: DUF4838 domain-containing protein, partial [Kiritimatiellia bacterium]
GDPVRWRSGGPPDITGAGRILKRAAALGTIGISIDMVWFHWATQGPQYYLMAQLAWQPDREIEDIMDDYYTAGFGPAADNIRDYWRLLEHNRQAIQKNEASWEEAFSAQFFQQAYGLLDQAAVLTADSGAGYAPRVEFVRAGLDYLRLNTANQKLARNLVESSGPEDEIRKEMLTNWEQIFAIAERHPWALNRAQTGRNPAANRMNYIHPDADHMAMEKERLHRARRAARRQVADDPEDLE